MPKKDSITDSLHSIKREPIPGSVLNILLDYILQKKLLPGDKLPIEPELAAALGVGRNSVREAIKMLVALNVVEIKRGQGTFVKTSISEHVFNPVILSLAFEQGTNQQLIEFRYFLEKAIMEMVIDKIEDGDIEKLEQANNKLLEAENSKIKDSKTLLEIDLKFHYELIELTRNPFIIRVASALYRLFFSSIEKTVIVSPKEAYNNHKYFIEAIRLKDKKGLLSRIIQGYAQWQKYVEIQK